MSRFLDRLRQERARLAALYPATFGPAKAVPAVVLLSVPAVSVAPPPPRLCPCGALAAMWLTDLPVTTREADGSVRRVLVDRCSRECLEGGT